jgi:hypothetical protein
MFVFMRFDTESENFSSLKMGNSSCNIAAVLKEPRIAATCCLFCPSFRLGYEESEECLTRSSQTTYCPNFSLEPLNH